MAATKTHAEPQTKAALAPTTAKQPDTPEKRLGPRHAPVQRAAAADMLADPEQRTGASSRARLMRAMQGSVGNTRVGRLATGPVVQRQPAVAPAPPAAAPPAPAITQTPMDAIVGASVLNELDRFRHIPIDVHGMVMAKPIPIAPEIPGLPTPIPMHQVVRVTIQAAYFINTATARDHSQAARRSARFDSIIRALEARGEFSLLEGERGRRRSAGKAVEYGKATPDDVKLFVEEALAQGAIRNYAMGRKGSKRLSKQQQLIDLSPEDLQSVIQDWVYDTGVGVDCSGLVQQIAIRTRERERAALGVVNAARSFLGLPPLSLPPEVGHEERGAGAFRGGPQVRRPTELRPGDMWVVSEGQHIRIVSAVREVTLANGTPTVEFDTAESSGSSKQFRPGPVARIWRVRSLKAFNPITRVGGGGGAVGGSFHRVP